MGKTQLLAASNSHKAREKRGGGKAIKRGSEVVKRKWSMGKEPIGTWATFGESIMPFD